MNIDAEFTIKIKMDNMFVNPKLNGHELKAQIMQEGEKRLKYYLSGYLLDPENKGNEYEDLIPKKNVRLDPCAPGISSKERLKRLSKFGEVRQVGPGDYEAGGRRVSIFELDNSLIYCR